MKSFLTLLLPCFLALAATTHAGSVEGDVYAIDIKAATIAISSSGKVQTFRIRPGVEITVNGVRSTLVTLNTAMTARVLSPEPGVATKIDAIGTPSTAAAPGPTGPAAAGAPPAAIPLKARLDGSQWRMEDGKVFTLKADGTTTGSWHERKGAWRITGPNAIEMTVNWAPQPPEKVTFNPEVTIASWRNDKGSHSGAKRVQP